MSYDPLPNKRYGYNQKFVVDGVTVYLRTSDYEDGRLGEIFINITSGTPVLGSMIDAFCITTSIALQHGAPLERIARKFILTKFPPNGMVSCHQDIKMCTSILDAVFRDLSIHYLGQSDLSHVSPSVD